MNLNKMANCNRPTTNWDFKRNKVSAGDSEIESLWDSCIEDESQSDKSAGDIVSIRCRRHKKRFNVERSWLETCKWLCPRCYEKLSGEERLKYAPKEDNIEIREKEVGKAVIYAQKKSDTKDGCICASNRRDANKIESIQSSKEESNTTEKEVVPAKSLGKGKVKTKPIESAPCSRVYARPEKDKDTNTTAPIFSPELMALMPDLRMECQKCGKVVPVHKMYIDNTSAVICPGCSSQMTPREIREFHKEHPTSKANISRVKYSRHAIPQTTYHNSVSHKSNEDCKKEESSDIAIGGFYSNSHIMAMSVPELVNAVRLGKLSKARARIEIGRRRNAGYFNSLPEVTPVAPMLPR